MVEFNTIPATYFEAGKIHRLGKNLDAEGAGFSDWLRKEHPAAFKEMKAGRAKLVGDGVPKQIAWEIAARYYGWSRDWSPDDPVEPNVPPAYEGEHNNRKVPTVEPELLPELPDNMLDRLVDPVTTEHMRDDAIRWASANASLVEGYNVSPEQCPSPEHHRYLMMMREPNGRKVVEAALQKIDDAQRKDSANHRRKDDDFRRQMRMIARARMFYERNGGKLPAASGGLERIVE